MTARLMVPGLHYIASDAELFKLIDQHGGWPVGYQFAGFSHTVEREAGFCNSLHNWPAATSWKGK